MLAVAGVPAGESSGEVVSMVAVPSAAMETMVPARRSGSAPGTRMRTRWPGWMLAPGSKRAWRMAGLPGDWTVAAVLRGLNFF